MNAAASLEPGWLGVLEEEFEKPYIQELRAFLRAEKDRKKVIYPRSEHWFAALNVTPFDQVKVVILGQDPYHGPGQAHGLCFSVPQGVRVPPSLINIYKELNRDLGMSIPPHGNLQSWAQQGVLLLNSTLTVEHSRAGLAPGQRLGAVYRLRGCEIERAKTGLSVSPLGSLCTEKRPDHR